MAFSSFNSVISAISSGSTVRSDWSYRLNVTIASSTSVSPAAMLSSYPGQYGSFNSFPGTSLTWVTCDETTGNGTQIFGIPHGGNVSPSIKHLMNASAIAPSAGVTSAGTLVLVDLQGYWANINLNSTSTQPLSGTPSLRYTNGEGCRLFLVATGTTGASARIATVNYLNQNGDSRSISSSVAVNGQRGQILNSLPHLTNRSLFFNLASGTSLDTGVSDVSSIQFNGTNTGQAALCLAKPLAYLPLTTSVNYPTEREFLFQTPGLPRIYDGACLTLLCFGVAATNQLTSATGFYGDLEVAWG